MFEMLSETGFIQLTWKININDFKIKDKEGKVIRFDNEKIYSVFGMFKSLLKTNVVGMNSLPVFVSPLHYYFKGFSNDRIDSEDKDLLTTKVKSSLLEQINYFNPSPNSKNNSRDLEKKEVLYNDITQTFFESAIDYEKISNEKHKVYELNRSIGMQNRQIQFKPSQTVIYTSKNQEQNINVNKDLMIASTDISLVQGQHSTDILTQNHKFFKGEGNKNLTYFENFQKKFDNFFKKNLKDTDKSDILKKLSNFSEQYSITIELLGFEDEINSNRFTKNTNNIKEQSGKDKLLYEYKDISKNLLSVFNMRESNDIKIIGQKNIYNNILFDKEKNIDLEDLLSLLFAKTVDVKTSIDLQINPLLDEDFSYSENIQNIEELKKQLIEKNEIDNLILFSYLEQLRVHSNYKEKEVVYQRIRSTFYNQNITIEEKQQNYIRNLIKDNNIFINDKINKLKEMSKKLIKNTNPNTSLANNAINLINTLITDYEVFNKSNKFSESTINEVVLGTFEDEIIKLESEKNLYKLDLLYSYSSLVIALNNSYKKNKMKFNTNIIEDEDTYKLIFSANIMIDIYQKNKQSTYNKIRKKYDDLIDKLYNDNNIDKYIEIFNQKIISNQEKYTKENFTTFKTYKNQKAKVFKLNIIKKTINHKDSISNDELSSFNLFQDMVTDFYNVFKNQKEDVDIKFNLHSFSENIIEKDKNKINI